MTSTSLISRPEIFRDMQSGIDTELGKTKPGLQIAGLHEAIGDVRDKIIGLVTQPMIKYVKSPPRFEFGFRDWTESLLVPEGTRPEIVWDGLKKQIQGHIKKVLNDVLNSLGKPKLTAALVDAIIASLSKAEVVARVNLAQYEDRDGRDRLAAVIAEIIVTRARTEVERAINIDWILTDAGRTELCDEVQVQLNILTSDLRSRLIDILNDAENELSEGIDEVSKKLVALNTGIGITQGKGSFNGGVYVSMVTQQSWQLGAYLNGQLNKGDSTQPTESLVGLHGRFASDAVQYDLLGAGLFGDQNYKAFKVMELGLAITVRTKYELLVGAAAYALIDANDVKELTVGISIQPTRLGSASFYIGIQGRNSTDVHPVVQTSIPILPSL
jgi:hypothetical protein